MKMFGMRGKQSMIFVLLFLLIVFFCIVIVYCGFGSRKSVKKKVSFSKTGLRRDIDKDGNISDKEFRVKFVRKNPWI